MKTFPFLSSLFAGMLLFSACSSELATDINGSADNKTDVRFGGDSDPMLLAAHKCNEITKLQDAVDYGIQAYEVDIHVDRTTGTPRLMIGHELETSTGQTFVEYMDDLMTMNPDFRFLWLDFKDLSTDENEAIIRETLVDLDSKYNIRQRVLVESRYITHLTWFADNGWHVSFYSTWSSLEGKTAAQQKEICDGWFESMQAANVDGISFDARVYAAMKTNFEDKTVNGRKVKQYAWNYYLQYTDADLQTQLQKYSHLAVLLIGFPNDEIPKLIMDVQFAENGVATNQGTPIATLAPEEGVVNAIATRLNSTYNQYEAVFDGTNFFYIPYTKTDAIGSAMGGKFSMEILFSPDGGINPFSSMESGGLGYELAGSNLKFYYNINGKWSLPGSTFSTPVQLGNNTYYRAVVTYDKTTAKMYINGTKVKETKVSGTFKYPNRNTAPSLLFGIGGDYRDSAAPSVQNGFIGKIVYARLYKGVLTAADVQQ